MYLYYIGPRYTTLVSSSNLTMLPAPVPYIKRYSVKGTFWRQVVMELLTSLPICSLWGPQPILRRPGYAGA